MRTIYEITSAIASASSDAAASMDAFGELYDRKFDLMVQLVRQRLHLDEMAAMDIAQDAMMRVIRHAKPIRTEAELDAWLSRVTLTTAYDFLRRERRRRARELAAASAPRPEKTLRAMDERLEELRTELRHMEAGLFDLLALRFRAGMTLEAIGQRVGLGPGAVDGRIRRGLATLKNAMEEPNDK